MRHVLFLLIFSALSLPACTLIDNHNQAIVQSHTQKRINAETGYKTFTGPDIKPETYWILRLFAEQKTDNTYQYTLLAKVNYYINQIARYDRYDESYPTQHAFHTLAWQELTCRGNRVTFQDSITIEFTQEDLEKKIESGIHFTFPCKDGSAELSVPGEYIKGFLQAVQEN